MAVIIPLLAVYGGATAGMALAAGTIAAGAATFAAGLAVAGGISAGLGLVTNNKKLQKFGSMLSLASGVVGALSAASSGAAAAGEASSAWDAAGSADGSDAGMLARNSRPIADAASPAGEIANAGSIAAPNITGPMAPGGMPFDGANINGLDLPGATPGALNGAPSSALTNSLTGAQQTPSIANAYQTPVQQLSSTAIPDAGSALRMVDAAPGGVQQAANGMAQSDIASYFKQAMEKSGKMIDGAGKWVQANPQLATIAGQTLQGYQQGAQADEAQNYQRSIYERVKKNLNNPVRLQYNPIGG